MPLPCVWMTAGLVDYRLCDRDLDCEHCPLDAALRGGRGGAFGSGLAAESLSAAGRRAVTFPDDRLYSPGHLWIAADGRARLRVGLDGFAAALVANAASIRLACDDGDPLDAGERLLDVELACGPLPLSAPVAGALAGANPLAIEDPSRVTAAPYDEGWLVELDACGGSASSLIGERRAAGALFGAEAAHAAAVHDLRHFRRQVAMHLLADPDEVGPTLADGGAALTDLRRILAPRVLLALLRELVH